MDSPKMTICNAFSPPSQPQARRSAAYATSRFQRARVTVGARRAQNLIHLSGALRVRMFGQCARQHRIANRARLRRGRAAQIADDLLRALRHQNLPPRFKELLDAAPLVGDQAGRRARRFKDARRRREADIGHRVAIDVQRHSRRGVDAIVRAGADVSDPAHVRRQRLAAPAFAAQNKAHLRRQFGGAQEELLHPPLAIRQAIAHKDQVAGQRRIGRFAMMRLRIEGVVNGMAVARSQPAIALAPPPLRRRR